MKVYIYALCDPDQPWNIRYVGKTVQSLQSRLSHHIHTTKLSNSYHRVSWIKSVLNKGLRPTIKLLDVGDETTWEVLEKFYINSYRQAGFDLVNVTDGGDGITGLQHSREVKERQRLRMLGNSITLGSKLTEEHKAKINPLGRRHSEETKKKIGEGNKGKIITTEQRTKIAATLTGRKHSEDAKRNMSSSKMGNKNRLGKKDSDETRKRKSEAMKRRHEAKISCPPLERIVR